MLASFSDFSYQQHFSYLGLFCFLITTKVKYFENPPHDYWIYTMKSSLKVKCL